MAVSAEASVQKYLRATTSGEARQRYIDGVAAVTESPMAKAASPEAMQLYESRVMESVRSGKRAKKLLEAPLSRWKDNATKKGAERLASGAQAAADKVRAHFQKWAPIYQQVSDAVSSMPKGGRANAKARADKAIDMLMDAAGRT